MAQATLRQRVIGNPGRRARGSKKKSRTRNPGEILGFVLSPMAGNPGRKRGSMAKTRKNRGRKNRGMKTNPGRRNRGKANPHRRRHHSYGHRRRRGNPGTRHHRRHHHRRNPGEIAGYFTNAVFVIVGALGSKLGAQAVLGTNNVGLVGYAGNAAAGAVLWFLAEKVMKNKAAANGIIAGTLVQIILRVINDYTPFGQYVANLGMGDYQMQSFVTPQVLVNPMQNADIQIPRGWGAGAPMSASAGPSQVSGGRRALAAAAAPATTAAAGTPSTSTGAPSGMGNLYGGNMSGLYG